MVKVTPDVSIVIPFYGRLPLVRQAVTAALRQRDIVCQIVVVDDGSHEDVSELQAFVIANGGTFIRQPHGGIAAARNAGLAASAGRWVTFVDSDDVIYPSKLAVQITAMFNTETPWSCTGFDLLAPKGDIIGGDSLDFLPERFWREFCPFGSTAVIADRKVVISLGGFDVAFDRSEDWDLFIRLGDLSSPAIVSTRLYGYRLQCGNVTGRDPEKWLEAWRMLCRKHDVELTFDGYPGIEHNLPQVSSTLFHSAALAKQFARG